MMPAHPPLAGETCEHGVPEFLICDECPAVSPRERRIERNADSYEGDVPSFSRRRDPDHYIINASHDGTCGHCNLRIYEGDEITKTDDGWIHAEHVF